MESKQKRDSLLICLFLAVATLLVYLPVTHFEFVNYDDPDYVSNNPRIKEGFSSETIKWAFTTTHASNWHPLTWISHMLDWSLYGANAGGHHLSSLLIHIATALLLFFALRLMTGAVWRSGFVAALFALHPLHVESVAWVSERKDVLSAFFWMLTLLFYARYVKSRAADERFGRAAIWNYAFALASFGLGLLAKQMLVTLPFVLLLLDLWPLQRANTFSAKALFKLFVEKLPFFVITGIFIPIAVWAQSAGHTVVSVSQIPFDQRVENALVSYLRYCCKMFWPTRLTVFYPYPDIWSVTMFSCAALFVLAGFAFAIWRLKRQKPLFFVGWCWFLGTLVPVIGIMQIGSQSMADRYSYIPLIGLFMIIAWGAYEWLHRVAGRYAVFTGALMVTGACMAVSVVQVRYWKDTVSLFTHALAVSEKNKVAHINLGDVLYAAGKTNEAIENFVAALKIDPSDSMAHGNLAGIFVQRGNWEEASSHYEAALQSNPRNPALHNAIGLAFARQDNLDQAIKHYEAALEINPDSSSAAFNLANAYLGQKKIDQAIAAYERVLRINPQDFAAHQNLAAVLLSRDRYAEAEAHLREAIRINPNSPESHHNLAMTYLAQQKANVTGNGLSEAVLHLKEAIRLDGNNAMAHFHLANIAAGQHDLTNAIQEYHAALEIRPDLAEALNNLAWILATSADAKYRNGDEAVRLAERACNVAGFKTPIYIGTLAAAYAEAGNFPKAVEMGEAAYELATSAGQNETANKNLELLTSYRAGRPYHEPADDGTKR